MHTTAESPARPLGQIATAEKRSSEFCLAMGLGLCIWTIAAFGGTWAWAWGSAGILACLALTLALFHRASVGLSLPSTPLFVPMLAFAALVSIQWAAGLSLDRSSTYTLFLQLLCCAAFFSLGLIGATTPGASARVGKWVWWLLAVLCLETLVQRLSPHPGYIYGFHDATYGTPFGPFINRNDFCGCLELLLPLACAAALRPVKQKNPEFLIWLLRGIVPLLALYLVVRTQSRGGAIAVAVELLFFAAMRPWRHTPARKQSRWKASAVLALPVLLYGWLALGTRYLSLSGNASFEPLRPAVWLATWHMFLDHWVHGVGFGAFQIIYPAYALVDSGKMLDYAHNDFVQMLAETGVIGAICVLAFVVILFWQSLHLMRREINSRPYRLAALAGCLGLMTHAVADFQFHIPANAFLFFYLAAVAVCPRHLSHQATGSTRFNRHGSTT